jgi:hypothetical protein
MEAAAASESAHIRQPRHHKPWTIQRMNKASALAVRT